MKKIQLPGIKEHLYADVSTDTVQPYIPKQHRYQLFCQLHDLSPWHPSITTHGNFIWDGINRRQTVDSHLHQMPSFKGDTPHTLSCSNIKAILFKIRQRCVDVGTLLALKLHPLWTSQQTLLPVSSSVHGSPDSVFLSASHRTVEASLSLSCGVKS